MNKLLHRCDFGIGSGLIRSDLLSAEQQMNGILRRARFAVEEHVNSGGMTESEAGFFGGSDRALQVGAADHEIDVARQHGSGGIGLFHVNQYRQAADN